LWKIRWLLIIILIKWLIIKIFLVFVYKIDVIIGFSESFNGWEYDLFCKVILGIERILNIIGGVEKGSLFDSFWDWLVFVDSGHIFSRDWFRVLLGRFWFNVNIMILLKLVLIIREIELIFVLENEIDSIGFLMVNLWILRFLIVFNLFGHVERDLIRRLKLLILFNV